VLRRFCVNDQYQCYAFGFNGKTGLPARRVVRITVQQPVPAPSVRSFAPFWGPVLLLAGLASLGFVVSSVVIVAGIVGRVIVGRVIIVAVVISFVFAIFVAVAERR
jgi:hypothetical protein